MRYGSFAWKLEYVENADLLTKKQTASNVGRNENGEVVSETSRKHCVCFKTEERLFMKWNEEVLSFSLHTVLCGGTIALKMLKTHFGDVPTI